MSTMPNFSLFEAGTSVPATTTSTSTPLPTMAGQKAPDVMIYNPDPTNVVYVRLGNASTTATASCMPILPGEKSVWAVRGATHLATIRAAGTTSLLVFPGEGN